MDRRNNECRQAIAGAAASLIGVPFRLHGRNPAIGLDCVGLVFCSLKSAGLSPTDPSGYRIRNLAVGQFLTAAKASGLIEADSAIGPGDILLAVPGPAQHHLLVAESDRSFIHAHVGLGRVVRSTAPLAWEVVKIWRAALQP